MRLACGSGILAAGLVGVEVIWFGGFGKMGTWIGFLFKGSHVWCYVSWLVGGGVGLGRCSFVAALGHLEDWVSQGIPCLVWIGWKGGYLFFGFWLWA